MEYLRPQADNEGGAGHQQRVVGGHERRGPHRLRDLGRGEIGAAHQRSDTDEEVEQLLGGEATGAQQRWLLQALILGNDADQQLDHRHQGHNVEDRGDS